jgi:hypothetical protein
MTTAHNSVIRPALQNVSKQWTLPFTILLIQLARTSSNGVFVRRELQLGTKMAGLAYRELEAQWQEVLVN